MAGYVTAALQRLDRFTQEYKDPRSDGLFGMSSLWPSVALCLLYTLAVTVVGPWWMSNRKPFEIKGLMIAYNFSMVAFCGYILCEFLMSGWLTGYSLRCQPVDYSESPQALRMLRACHLFYISKFVEFVDTIFFVMRKKFTHISFLHVFHHGIMPASWWFGVKFVPGGFGTFHAMLNCFIHVVMYLYYGLAAMGPQYHKYIWWKKHLTKMQIGQFIIVTLHSVQLLFISCDYPIIFAYWILSYALIFLFMFLNFYIQAYRSRSRKEESNNSSKLPDDGIAGSKKLYNEHYKSS
ncbi:very long chain fatty acid elongase 7-like [Watersipora subatra]|uniref:very long chain fatty acid elongase 7-like n=1 Tax=Watersipora subatra TaxID=2589382 RepID=UPI00355BD828